MLAVTKPETRLNRYHMSSEPATVGLLTDHFLYEWQVRAIERLQAETDVEIPLVVSDCRNVGDEAESWNSKDSLGLDDVTQFLEVFRTERAWTLVLAERTLGRVLGDDQELWHRHSVENVDALADADHVRCEPITEDGWNELPAGVVDELADRCDVLVRFGFGLIRGDVLTATEHGVLSFHPADIRKYRGMGVPAIFHDGQDRGGATLQRLDESIDGGEIVAYDDVSLADCYTLWDAFDQLATLQIRLLPEGIERLRDPSFEPRTVPDEQLGEFYSRSERRTPAFAGRVLARNVTGRLRRRLAGESGSETAIERAAESAD